MTSLTGTWAIVRLVLRRDRIRLPVWILSILGLVYFSVGAVQDLYDTQQAQASYAALVESSGATIALSGPPIAVDTLGGITVYETSFTAIIATALMAIFLGVRHTRADEEAGRTELLLAGTLGRHATTTAVTLVIGTATTVIGAGVALSFVSVGLPTSGSVLFGVSVAAVGWVFIGITMVAAQVTEHARGAIGLALVGLAVAFLIRAVGDVVESSTVSLFSPIGWTQQVRAFGEERWWPLLLSAGLTGTAVALTAWLVRHRDVGAGLVAPRPGPPHASPALATPAGFAFRLQRASILAWLAGMVLAGVVFGSLGQGVEDLIESNPDMEDFIIRSGGGSIVDAYFAMVLMISALIATGFTVASVLRLRSEESAGRTEALLATPLSRHAWSLGSLAVTLVGTAVVFASTGVATAVTHVSISGRPSEGWELVAASIVYLPAALLLGGLGFALVGWFPRAVGAAWGVLAVCVVIGWLGELLSLPAWLLDASPYSRTPQLPMEDLSWAPVVLMTLIALALTALGSLGLQRRDVV